MKHAWFGSFVLLTLITLGQVNGSEVWSEVKGNTAIVHHDMAYFNCCPDMFFEILRDGFTIDIYEGDLYTHPCNCDCHFNFTHELEGLEPGAYNARVWRGFLDGRNYLCDSTTFNILERVFLFNTSSWMTDCLTHGIAEESQDEGLTLEPVSQLPNQESAKIEFHLPFPEAVGIQIFDVSGSLVKKFELGGVAAGDHLVVWDTRNQVGQQVSRGIYFVRLEAGEDIRTLSLVVLR